MSGRFAFLQQSKGKASTKASPITTNLLIQEHKIKKHFKSRQTESIEPVDAKSIFTDYQPKMLLRCCLNA